jgi:CRISPR-associated endonuclease/helicase Cas3
MFPVHLDLWAQTSPEPVPSPDVAPFLHGPAALGAADVQLVWRADLSADPDDQDWVGVVAVAPPRSREALPLPLAAALGWLGQEVPEVADQEGTGAARAPREIRPAVCWRGPDASFVAQSADEIRPGDTLVVPSAYGGLDTFGWDPRSTAPVEDVADSVVNEMADAASGLRSVRVRFYRGWASGAIDATLTRLADRLADGENPTAVTEELFVALDVAPQDALTSAVLRAARATRCRLSPYPAGVVLTARVKPGFVGRVQQEADANEGGDEAEDETSLLGAAVALGEHLAGVARWTGRTCESLGLAENLRAPLVRAAELHDLGKVDWRFQYPLYGDEPGVEPLAKSGRQFDCARERVIREWAGLPHGFRHEFVSVALVHTAADRLLGGLPREQRGLVEYLVGTHHGRGRPFPPVVPETKPEPVSLNWEGCVLTADANHGLWRLDAGWAEQFWGLIGRHGPWGLAFLESVLRLADGARSAEEARQ